MLRVFVFAVFLTSVPLLSQEPKWSQVDLHTLNPELLPARLSVRQQAALGRVIHAYVRANNAGCGEDVSWVKGLSFSYAPLGPHKLLYVSPGMGCMRGGQGANASLWLVTRNSGKARVIGDAEGWGLGIQQHTSHRMHDFVTGWHMSAAETYLYYYRFDGRSYRKIGERDVIDCAELENDPNASGSCYREGGRPLDTTPALP